MFQCTLFENSISLALLYVLLAIYMPRDSPNTYEKNSYDWYILSSVCCCAMLCFAYMKFWMPISKTSTAQFINKSICSINSYNKKKDDRQWRKAESNLLLAKNSNHKMFKLILCCLNYIVLMVLGKKHFSIFVN